MKYNLADRDETIKAFEYLTELAGKEVMAEVKKLNPKRSLNQNNYLHLLLGAFGAHFGYTLDEAKTVYKRDICPSIYVYEKNNHKFLRSTADLDKTEMTKSIDRLREFANEQGLYLPPAENAEELRALENSIEGMGYYL